MKNGPVNRRVLVTSGPTRAWIDRVRYIANASTGALGARIVEVLVGRGFAVKHIRGVGAEVPGCPPVDTSVAETVDDLAGAVREAAAEGGFGAFVHAMAVLDYVPERRMDGKRPSDSASWDLRLVRTPKVTALIRSLMPDAVGVGFKLETGVGEEELVRRALASLEAHGLDLVVANDLDVVGPDHHEAVLVEPSGRILARCSTKDEIAGRIALFIEERLHRGVFFTP